MVQSHGHNGPGLRAVLIMAGELCYGADGLFAAGPTRRVSLETSENQPIAADSRRDRADFESPKYPSEINSANS
jgi:hypothetical protein